MMRADLFRLSPFILLAAALMAASVLLVYNAQPAAAQTTPVWSATLTVDKSGGDLGCDDAPGNQDNCSTALTDNEFTYNGGTYRVTALIWDSDINRLLVFVSKDGQGLSGSQIKTELGSLRLNVDGTGLAVSSAAAGTDRIRWNFDPATDWTDGQQVSLSLIQPPDEAYLCPGSPDSSLNPTDLGAFEGKRVLTLHWLNPETDRGFGYAVRWRKNGTTAWLNPHGAVGEVSNQQPRYTHDITGLEDSTSYDAQVRIVLQRVSSAVNQGRAQPGGCSEWVSVTRSTRGLAGSEPAPAAINITTSGPLREGGPSVNVFFILRTAQGFDAPALAEGGATLGASIPADDTSADWWVRWNPEVAEGAIVAVMQMYVPEDEDDNNCRERKYSVTFPSQVAGGAYLSADFTVTVVDNDGTADTGCTGEISGSGGTGGV